MAVKERFAGYPTAVAFAEANGKKAVRQLRWGEWVLDMGERKGTYSAKDVHNNPVSGKFVKCRVRNQGDCWIREHEIQDERLLEIVFVDIGQGDGCLVVTPKDKKMVIDAGEGDNMYRFLRWRFGKFSREFRFESAVISHPDKDHYGGFDPFFEDENVFFDTIYHNGIIERFGKNPLGPKKKVGRRSFLTDLLTSKTALKNWLAVKSRWQRTSASGRLSKKQYPKMLHKALSKKRFGRFTMLSHEDEYLPGYEAGKDLEMQILGPVVEKKNSGKPTLRWLSSAGKTKNGHSVVFRAKYKGVSILLGGDLNIPAENLLMSHHTGLVAPAKTVDDEKALIDAAREVFEVDIAKACHHGSGDFSSTYLKATNPIATVISSGDDEPHAHPRADTLGTIGVCSRDGGRPLIFSTELARSSKEHIKHPKVLKQALFAELDEIEKASATTPAEIQAKAKRVERFKDELDKQLDRSVATYGAVNVVTDGKKVVIAQKLERARSKRKMWDVYRLEAEGNGPLRYQSKH